MIPDWFKEGAQVRIIANTNCHHFPIGSVAVLHQCYDKYDQYIRKAYSNKDWWWVKCSDCVPITTMSLEKQVKDLLG